MFMRDRKPSALRKVRTRARMARDCQVTGKTHDMNECYFHGTSTADLGARRRHRNAFLRQLGLRPRFGHAWPWPELFALRCLAYAAYAARNLHGSRATKGGLQALSSGPLGSTV